VSPGNPRGTYLEKGLGMVAEKALREYVVHSNELGVFKIKIPGTWKVTWGKSVPDGKTPYREDTMCMRIYENQNLQRAAFNGVTYFRDLSLELSTADGEDWILCDQGQEIQAVANMRGLRGDGHLMRGGSGASPGHRQFDVNLGK